ncbi:MAG: hypothetical protein Q7K45_01140 [Nanoarchaeota archaeon]|nr:hypothetical protein [Nanoarchaeota archaeon]
MKRFRITLSIEGEFYTEQEVDAMIEHLVESAHEQARKRNVPSNNIHPIVLGSILSNRKELIDT